MPEPEKKSPYDILLEMYEKDHARLDTLEQENKEIIEFNKALLARNGNQQSTKVDSDVDSKRAKDKLNKYLEEN